jgi:2-polyprenyl-6-methoxyphenol hydroxylase-like FAD-dependent oxidoreductase
MSRAVIVGAGIGGLAAGIALRRIGWDIEIVERADAPRELGFGVGLAPNALAALREIGVVDAILAHATAWRSPTAAEIRHIDGRVIRRFAGDPAALSKGDGLLRIIMRPALHGALLDVVRDAVRVSREAVRVDASASQARVIFRDGTYADGDVVVGADGIHSIVRAQLHPDEAPARSSGYYALRGASRNLQALNGLQALWYLGPGVESGVVQAGADAIYWFLSLLVEDERRAGTVDARTILRRWLPRFDAQFRAIVDGSELRLDELFVRDPIRNWGGGPVTLLGDAAHPMLPHTGQGAAQALEDAVGLARALRSAGDIVSALRRYEAVRSRGANAVVRSGPMIARVTTTRSAVIAAIRNAAIHAVPMSLLAGALARSPSDPSRELGPPLTT